MEAKQWDIFVSHAAEDKETVARPLARALRQAGVRVWLDEQELTVGDSLSEKIDEGLVHSRFGVVILSPAFFTKHWPRKELAGLRSREEGGQKVILPIWHNVDKATVSQFSPILADVLAANTEQGIYDVAEKLLDVIFPDVKDDLSPEGRSAGRRLIEILESSPDKETLVEFLRFHIPRTGGRLGTRNLGTGNYYLGWEGVPVMEEYELYDVVFDAHALSVGHGIGLTLVNFTEVWTDPFETDAQGGLGIHQKISSALSAIESVQRCYSHDLHQQAILRDWLGRDYPFFVHEPEYFNSLVPALRFFVYAGRRSEIDASPARHNLWSQIRNYRNNVYVRSYDQVIDALL